MSHLKVRLRFNPGRHGSPMDKLGEFASQMEKFLRALSSDLGVDAKKGKWLAQNFTNESVAFDGEYSESVNAVVAARAEEALDVLSGDEPFDACNKGLVSFGTISEFSKVSKVLDADEFFYMGIYRDDRSEPARWKTVSYKKISEIRQLLEAPFVTNGSLQGIVYSWHAGANPRFFQLREVAGGNLVRCEYSDRLHCRIHEATRTPNTVIHVYGDISWDRTTDTVTKMDVGDIEMAEALSDFEFHKLFGSATNFTGGLSTSDYISWMRDDEE